MQMTATTRARLPQLRIDLLEIPLVDQHLARLAAGARRNKSFGFHHVHEPRGAAEADAKLALQIRDGHLPAADDDARGLVVEIVLLELEGAGSGLLFLRGDRVVEDRLTLLAQKAREPGALLLRDVRPVQADAPR